MLRNPVTRRLVKDSRWRTDLKYQQTLETKNPTFARAGRTWGTHNQNLIQNRTETAATRPNDTERAWMRNLDSHSGAFSYYPLASAFHHNSAVFQKSIQPTTKPQ
jgi:hypothetical protein